MGNVRHTNRLGTLPTCGQIHMHTPKTVYKNTDIFSPVTIACRCEANWLTETERPATPFQAAWIRYTQVFNPHTSVTSATSGVVFWSVSNPQKRSSGSLWKYSNQIWPHGSRYPWQWAGNGQLTLYRELLFTSYVKDVGYRVLSKLSSQPRNR